MTVIEALIAALLIIAIIAASIILYPYTVKAWHSLGDAEKKALSDLALHFVAVAERKFKGSGMGADKYKWVFEQIRQDLIESGKEQKYSVRELDKVIENALTRLMS